MLSKIIEAESRFNVLLPAKQIEFSLPPGLINAAREWSDAVWAAAEEMGPMPLTAEELTLGFQLAQNPVFICGVHRSGTTLLKDILDGHPELVVLPSEGTYYTNIERKLSALPQNEWAAYLGKEWLRRIANPINQPPYWLLGRSSNDGSPYVEFARYVIAWWNVIDQKQGMQWPHMVIVLAYASCTGNLSAKLWVDKTPTNERFINRIRQEMPSAKIIQMIREPVATLTSRKKMEPSISLRNALRYLKASFSIAAEQQRLNKPGYLLVRYEDLCKEPQTVTKQIAGFLGIEELPTLSKPSVAGKPSQANSSFNKEPITGIILKPHQHPQQVLLSPGEQKLIAACMGKLAKKHQYIFAKVGTLRSLYLKFKYRVFI